jgi:hypothetical protein
MMQSVYILQTRRYSPCAVTPTTYLPAQVTAEDILGHRPGTNVRPEDIVIGHAKFNYGMKDKNPVDAVHFFSRWEDNDSFSIPKEKVSGLIPNVFSERFLRVYCTPTMFLRCSVHSGCT